MSKPGDANAVLRNTPRDANAERAVLSCLMMDPERAIPDNRGRLHEELFFARANRVLFETMIYLESQGPFDLTILLSELEKTDRMNLVGSRKDVIDLFDDIPSTKMLGFYLDILEDCHLRRTAIQRLTETAAALYEPKVDTIAELKKAAEFASESAESKVSHESTKSAKQMIYEAGVLVETAYENKGKLPGVSSGIIDFDNRTNGFKEGDFVVIKAFPGVGKTAFGFQVLKVAAIDHVATLAMSAEMMADSIGIRMISSETGLNGLSLHRGTISEIGLRKFDKACKLLSELPLWVDDRANMTIADVEAVTSRMVRKHKVRLVLVDYIQLLKPQGEFWSRQEAVANISSRLKGLAKEFGVSVIGLSQCNNDGRSREAADIEQDADVVLSIKNVEEKKKDGDDENKEEEKTETIDREVKFRLEKVRGGIPGSWPMIFHGETTTFGPKYE